MEKFKLTTNDKVYLLSIGYPMEEFKQIEDAARMCIVSRMSMPTHKETRSSINAAIRVLGREKVLASLGRAAFHAISMCSPHSYAAYYFDCHNYFNK